MKKGLLKIFASLILVVSIAGCMLLSVACSENGCNPSSDTNVTDSSDNSGNSAGDPANGSNSGSNSGSEGGDNAQTPAEPKAVEREGFSLTEFEERVSGMTIKEFVDLLSGKDLSALSGIKVGDVLNFIIESSVGNNGIAGFNADGLTYGVYDNGKWFSKRNNKELHLVLNAILDYELDGSKPLAITESERNTYYNSTVLSLSTLKDSANKEAILMALDQLDTSSFSGVFSISDIFTLNIGEIISFIEGEPIEKISVLLSFVGENTFAELAAVAGKDVPEMIAGLTLNEVYDFIAPLSFAESEEDVKQYLVFYAFMMAQNYIEENGDKVLFGDVTISDIMAAIFDDSGESAKAIAQAAAKYVYDIIAEEYGIDVYVSQAQDYIEQAKNYYEENKDTAVIGDMTIGELVELAIAEKDPSVITDAIAEAIEEKTEDEEFMLAVTAVVYEYIDSAATELDEKYAILEQIKGILEEYTDIEIDEDLTVDDILENLSEENVNAAIEELYNALLEEYGEMYIAEDVTVSDAVAILTGSDEEAIAELTEKLYVAAIAYAEDYAKGTGIDKLFEEYYGSVENFVVYKNYTVADIVNGAKELSPEEAFAVVMAEFYSIQNEENYILSVISPVIAYYISEGYIDVEQVLIEEIDYTVAYLMFDLAMGEPYYLNQKVAALTVGKVIEDSDIDLTTGIDIIDELISALKDLTVSELYEGVYKDVVMEYVELCKDNVIYQDYTVADLLEDIEAGEPVILQSKAEKWTVGDALDEGDIDFETGVEFIDGLIEALSEMALSDISADACFDVLIGYYDVLTVGEVLDLILVVYAACAI